MKKIRALALCAILLVAWCVPISAAGASNYDDEIMKAVRTPFTVGNYRYTLPDSFTSHAESFLNSHPITDQTQANAIVTAVNSAEGEIETAVAKGASQNLLLLPASVKTQIYLLMNGVPGTGLHFSRVGDSIHVTGSGTEDFNIPTLDRVDISNPPTPTGGGSSSSGVSNVPTGPAAPIVVVTSGGGTQVNVSGVADSAPTVSGGTASLSMTVPTDATSAVTCDGSGPCCN
jgi:hypothetical protein